MPGTASWLSWEQSKLVTHTEDVDAYHGAIGTLWKTAADFSVVAHRDVPVCKRDNDGDARKLRVHPSRQARSAKLSIQVAEVL